MSCLDKDLIRIAYAADEMGGGFSMSPEPNSTHVGFFASKESDVVTPEMFSWMKIVGEDGRNGTSFLTGLGDPLSASGNNGDTYLDLTSGAMFKRIANEWHYSGVKFTIDYHLPTRSHILPIVSGHHHHHHVRSEHFSRAINHAIDSMQDILRLI